jgi:hypothetical protein
MLAEIFGAARASKSGKVYREFEVVSTTRAE